LPEAGAQSTRWRRRQTAGPCHATVAGLSQSFHRRRPRSEKHRRRPADEHRATLHLEPQAAGPDPVDLGCPPGDAGLPGRT
ncbi:hypothetical protein BST37_23075, partial [Mycobacterium noviomagense]